MLFFLIMQSVAFNTRAFIIDKTRFKAIIKFKKTKRNIQFPLFN